MSARRARDFATEALDKIDSDSAFYCGFAAALGCLIRSFDQPGMAIDIMHSNGVTLQMLKDSRVEKFDLDPIKKEWREA